VTSKGLEKTKSLEKPTKHDNSESPHYDASNDERLAYSVAETAKLLGKTHTTVRSYIALGEIRPIDHKKGRILISRKEINRFLRIAERLAILFTPPRLVRDRQTCCNALHAE